MVRADQFNIDVSGVSIAVKRLTSGNADEQRPTIVFLHDSLGCITLWRHFPESLAGATGCDALIYDRQGYGQSDPFASKRTPAYLDAEAHVLLELLEVCEVGKAVLFGHSDGGTIALLAGGFAPERFSAILSEGAHVFVEELSLAGIRDAQHQYATTNLRERLARYHGDKVPAVFSAWTDTWLSPEFRDWSMESRLALITCPVLAMQGANDEFGTEHQVDTIVGKVSGLSRKLMVQGIGHTPHKDAAGFTLEVAGEFISQALQAEQVRACT